jgi:hypothetical protein
MKFPGFTLLVLFGAILIPGSVFKPTISAEEKMKPEALVARHLDAIGNAEARAKAASRVASGSAQLIIRVGGASNLTGSTMFVSSGARFRFGMKFPMPDYTGEDFAFDGNQAAAGFLSQGRRSQLSIFVTQQPVPLKEGLLGGVLSTAWPLLRLDQSQPKLEYRGLKKVDGKQLHELGYRPRKGSTDLKILLHFDPETFRHVRSRYQFEVGATIGTREASNQNVESYYSVTEEFDDFRAVDGLMLPHKYRIQYSAEGRAPSALNDWAIIFDRIAHNAKLDDQLFTLK